MSSVLCERTAPPLGAFLGYVSAAGSTPLLGGVGHARSGRSAAQRSSPPHVSRPAHCASCQRVPGSSPREARAPECVIRCVQCRRQVCWWSARPPDPPSSVRWVATMQPAQTFYARPVRAAASRRVDDVTRDAMKLGLEERSAGQFLGDLCAGQFALEMQRREPSDRSCRPVVTGFGRRRSGGRMWRQGGHRRPAGRGSRRTRSRCRARRWRRAWCRRTPGPAP